MRTIKFKSNGMGRYDDVSPFLVESGELELSIPLPDKAGEFYLVSDNNGKKATTLIPRDGTVSLAELQAGELRAEVKHYLRGVLIESYKIEPLLLKAVDKTLSAMPEIAALEDKIKEQGAKLGEISEHLERVSSEAYERECALLRYVYSDYQTNVQLNGLSLSFADFCKAIGFDLSESGCEGFNEKLDI